jgi:2,4-dienoyl-CoA reductase-like NADH-dependent reductase (Old Yellow Enzyme family)
MQRAFLPLQIGQLLLRNRFLKAATYEGMSPGGVPTDKLIEYHATLAANGVGLTTVAYCAISEEGRTFENQLLLSAKSLPQLKRLTRAVHDKGGAASLQLAHCGSFTKYTKRHRRPRAPSFCLNTYGLLSGVPFADAMTTEDINDVVRDFAASATRAAEAGFDALELHFGHGYLLSQFLSPAINKRTDQYGGQIENRMRLPLEVLSAVRQAVGPEFPVLAKVNMRDGIKGGVEIDDAIVFCRRLTEEGIHGVVLSGGFVNRNPFFLLRGDRPLRGMIRVEHNWGQKLALMCFGPFLIHRLPFTEMFFHKDACQIKEAVPKGRFFLLGGIVSADNVKRAMETGFTGVVMGRALIADPELIADWSQDPSGRSQCIACNQCVVEMDRHGVQCTLPFADQREAS